MLLIFHNITHVHIQERKRESKYYTKDYILYIRYCIIFCIILKKGVRFMHAAYLAPGGRAGACLRAGRRSYIGWLMANRCQADGA